MDLKGMSSGANTKEVEDMTSGQSHKNMLALGHPA